MDAIGRAVDRGLGYLDMYEIWEYEVTMYEIGVLFIDFVIKFLNTKQETSGFPTWCRTEEDKYSYITDYLKHEGIKLKKKNR